MRIIWFSKFKYLLALIVLNIIAISDVVQGIRESGPALKAVSQNAGNEGGMILFYQIQAGFAADVIQFATGFLGYIIIPMIFSQQVIKSRITKSDSMLITRMNGNKNYLFSAFYTNAVLTFFAFLSAELMRLVLIVIFYAPIHLNQTSWYLTKSIQYYIFKNGLANLVAFILLFCIGQALFSSLVLSIGLYLKNHVVYLLTGLAVALIGIAVPGLVGPQIISHNSFWTSILSINALIQPALSTVGMWVSKYNGGLVWLGSFAFYGLITTTLLAIRIKIDAGKHN